jgi:hypothetical protein
MGFPKQIKKKIELTPKRTLYPRRVELIDKINEHGTYLPKSLLHADLDRGFLDFVKNDLSIQSEGKKVPMVDILITTQNWSQFTQTWDFQDLDKNISLPFICVVRNPEVKYGTNPSLLYTIPVRRQFYYASVPSFDGNRVNVDLYKIPQPVPVDIVFSVKIICNRMRELNTFNKTVMQKFSSRQAYTVIKGHYVPIVMNSITDESVMEIEKRKFYLQSYEFTMLGFLVDEEEFEVVPAVERIFQIYEAEGRAVTSKLPYRTDNPNIYPINVEFPDENVTTLKRIYDRVDLTLQSSNNVSNFDIYINGMYYGSNVTKIQVNSGELLKFDITKVNANQTSNILFEAKIV